MFYFNYRAKNLIYPGVGGEVNRKLKEHKFTYIFGFSAVACLSVISMQRITKSWETHCLRQGARFLVKIYFRLGIPNCGAECLALVGVKQSTSELKIKV